MLHSLLSLSFYHFGADSTVSASLLSAWTKANTATQTYSQYHKVLDRERSEEVTKELHDALKVCLHSIPD
jgi:hypothetical protein